MDPDLLEQLKALHTQAIDARNGYEEARDDAGGHDPRPLFQDLIAVHTKNADDLSHVLQRSGSPPSWDGSFMSTVNRAVMNLRSLIGGLGGGVVGALIDSETSHLSRYDHLLGRADAAADVREVLQRNRDRLEAAIARLRDSRA